jgi:predicted anti-sigma-YlaC factor YlaD
LALSTGCATLKRAALGQVADALAEGGKAYASDEDPELIKQAVPFSLKLMESTLEQNPKHLGLLRACASGFTQYAYGFVVQEAEELESKDYAAAEVQRARAKKLYLRAKNYGLRGLELVHPGLSAELAQNPKAALSKTTREDVALLYWTAAAWGGAVSLGKDDPSLISEVPMFEALIDRALELDEAWGAGSIHSFLISYEMARQGPAGDPALRSQKHFERALALSEGLQAGPYVSLAEAVCVEQRDAARFEQLLQKALAIDPNARPEYRLENLIMQRRARRLLDKKNDLFLSSAKPTLR